MSEATKPGSKILNDIKKKEKAIKEKEKEMKTKSTTLAVIISVVVTIVTVSALGGMFFLGMKYNQSVNDRIHTEAKALVITTTQVSKQ